MCRIHLKLTESHFEIINNSAIKELNRFLNDCGSPPGKYNTYKNKLIGIFLCQGAAQHYIDFLKPNYKLYDEYIYVNETEVLDLDGKAEGVKLDDQGNVLSGINDIDVWFFFHKDNDIAIPDAKNMRKEDKIFLDGFGNIKIHFMKKTIKNKSLNNSIKDIMMSYVNSCRTKTAYCLSKKSIIGLYPESIYKVPIYKCCRRLESYREESI